jgi:hypothetical protein
MPISFPRLCYLQLPVNVYGIMTRDGKESLLKSERHLG